MKAIAVIPGTKTVQLVDRPEPAIVAPDDIKLKCCAWASAAPTARRPRVAAPRPRPHEDLVLGHEMFGQVVDVGRAVTRSSPATTLSSPFAAAVGRVGRAP